MKFDICVFFENMARKFQFDQNLTATIAGSLCEDPMYIYDNR